MPTLRLRLMRSFRLGLLRLLQRIFSLFVTLSAALAAIERMLDLRETLARSANRETFGMDGAKR